MSIRDDMSVRSNASKRVTIATLAEHLGLTKGTVSRALNGYPDISELTRARVRKAADRLGYRPLGNAQAIRTGRVRSLGLVLQVNEHDGHRPFVAQFIGSPKMNILPCETSSDGYRLPGGRGGAFSGDHAAVQLGIRPEHISLGAAGTGQCDGAIDVIEYLGADSFLVIDAGPLGQLTVRTSGDTDLNEGDNVGLTFDADRLSFFDAGGLRV